MDVRVSYFQTNPCTKRVGDVDCLVILYFILNQNIQNLKHLFTHSDKPMWEFKNRLCQMSSYLQLRCFKELGNVTVKSMLILGHDWLENETKLVLDWFKTNNSLIDQKNRPSNELPSKAIQIKIWRIFVIKLLITKWTTDIRFPAFLLNHWTQAISCVPTYCS